VDPFNFGCRSGEFCAAAVICNIINFDTGGRCQKRQAIMVAVMNEPKKKEWTSKDEGFCDGSITSAITSDFP
jgi:hypothetical protein